MRAPMLTRLLRRMLPALAWIGLCGAPSAAAQPSPAAFVDGIVAVLGNSIKAAEAALGGDGALPAAAAIIERDVAPHMDFGVITREAAAGAWEAASAAQKAALVREFRALLVHVLARLLVTNRGDTLNVLTAPAAANAREAAVRVAVTRPRSAGQAPEPMLVTVRRSGDAWKIRELRTDGVDVVRLYSANFAVVIERQGGIEGLIRALAERNARNAQAAVAPPPALTPRVLVEDACIGCASP
ncbi:MAG: ABC transporter substrate-binding protein [Burkholderiales bacterium]|nr:ABC transporter substrate-binding protein [Burkholderiales bacterium]